MKERKFYFCGGLPRAGSTLIQNILNQNPLFHATQTSGCMDVMFGVRNQWKNLIEHQATPNDEALQRVLQGILYNYYANVEKPIIVDKCRGWISLIEMAEYALGHKVKIIVPVRDMRDVISSFELLWRKQANKGQMNGEAQNYIDFQSVEGRAAFFTRKDQPIGLAYTRIVDAFNRGFGDRMCLVPFEELTMSPDNTMKSIYEFLGEDYYKHDFNNVEQVTKEDDFCYGFADLHTIRPKVEVITPRYPTVLGDVAKRYSSLNFWRNDINYGK